MEEFGFIHGELDTKLLILYVLRKLPTPIDPVSLEQICLLDGGVQYFDYAECLANLVETKHIDEFDGPRYLITAKGIKNITTAESSLPYSVRTKVDAVSMPLAETMRRDAMIVTRFEEESTYHRLYLSLADGMGEIINLSMIVPDEASAVKMGNTFRRQAEDLYGKIVELLLED